MWRAVEFMRALLSLRGRKVRLGAHDMNYFKMVLEESHYVIMLSVF